MAKASRQKTKILFILKILSENTDEHHVMETQEIIRRLADNDIHAERKSIYDDINTLINFGYDIIQRQCRNGGGYYLASRDFELAELKLLVDAVQSSRFITVKKSRELIGKLEHLASKHDAVRLQRQVYVAGRIKTENEGIYYNIDSIHRAIQGNSKIRFTYYEWSIRKELKPRKGGEVYQVSPWALIWREENYYLAAFDHRPRVMKHYRVDKMGTVELLNEKREGMEEFSNVDLAAYTNRTFGMFGGKEEIVILRFPDELAGVVMDRFGKEIDIRSEGDGFFKVRVSVVVSGQFFGWLAGIGRDARIVSPDLVRDKYIEWLGQIIRQHQV